MAVILVGDIISTSILNNVPAMLEHPGTRPLHIGGVTMLDILSQKRCSKCGEWKSKSEYNNHKRSKDGLNIWCKDCVKSYRDSTQDKSRQWRKEYYKSNKEKLLKVSKEYRAKNPLAHTEDNLRRKYGINLSEYNEILERQGGVCGICGKINMDGKKLSVDHHHGSGKVRGLLCSKCNTAIGLMDENTNVFERAINYLKEHLP